MQHLELVNRTDAATWYRLSGLYQGEVARWVVSTPQTVEICNRSHLVGVEFSNALRDGLSAAVAAAPFRPFLEAARSSQLCVINFLRGSLNFNLREVLHAALGSNHHATCFMSSQRYREDGRWQVKEDMYRKLEIPDRAILLFGDVVATGVTAANGLEVIADQVRRSGTTIRGLVFFTIGCHKIEKILEAQHQRCKQIFPGYEQTHVVYLEGKFRLVDSSTPVVIGIPGTDLIKREALLSPELELSQYDSLEAPLERCVIYDAGSRAFDVREYLTDVYEYWGQVRALARRGHTLADALVERWPEAGFASRSGLRELKADTWHGVAGEVVDELHHRYEQRWSSSFTQRSATAEALDEVAGRRIEDLGTLMSQLNGGGESA